MLESNRHWIAYYLATTTPQRDPLRVTPVKRRSRVKWGPAASPSSASDRRRLLRWPRRVLSTNACGNKAEFGDDRINNRIRFIITIGAAMMRHRCLVEGIRYVPQAEQCWQSIAEKQLRDAVNGWRRHTERGPPTRTRSMDKCYVLTRNMKEHRAFPI